MSYLKKGKALKKIGMKYEAENIFWVPKEARWGYLKDNAKDPKIGQIIDDAMILIEKENPTLKEVLDKRYARPELDKRRLGELIDLISTIKLHKNGEKDLLGRVYEYFLGQFASSEGKGGGEFYTPTSVVKTLVEMIEPYRGRIYDPACGSGGMFIQSEKFIEEHAGRIDDLSIYGQELNATTWKLCKMNLAIRGLDGNIGPHQGDTFHDDLHKTLKADYVLANPPFNISDWGGNKLVDDIRWKYGVPPEGNANYAWLEHIVYHLAPNGVAGIVLANGALSSNTSNEGVIRKNLVDAKLVDAIVALPDKLFYSTGIPVSLWILNRNKIDNPKFRKRADEILFIDGRNLGTMVDRRHRELSDEDIKKIADTYHNYRNIDGNYEDVQGFCKAAKLEEVREHEYVLTPGRYVGIEEQEDDGVPFEEKMEALTSELGELFEKSRSLEEEIRKNLGGIVMSFNEWTSIKLGELIESISIKHDFEKDELIFLNTSDVLEGKVLHDNYSEVSKMPGQAKKSIQKGDILFSEIRPKNKRFAYIDFDAKDFVVSTKLMVLRRKSSLINNKFLYKLLTSDRMLNYLQHIAEGRSGTFPQITFSELKNIYVLLPSIQEQIAIAKTLDDLDGKIEINNKINKALEEMAQAIFKQWFVDFEFPNEEGKPYKSSGGEMVESELGMIPKGWDSKSLLDIADYLNGLAMQKFRPEDDEKGIPVLKN